VELNCPFCQLDEDRIWLECKYAIAVRDGFPVSQGHSLVIARRHVSLFYELSDAEQNSIWQLAAEIRYRLDAELSPDGFNVGLNDGEAAGQTIPHVHVHVIPRWKGDVEDPRGGVRWVIPHSAPYWD